MALQPIVECNSLDGFVTGTHLDTDLAVGVGDEIVDSLLESVEHALARVPELERQVGDAGDDARSARVEIDAADRPHRPLFDDGGERLVESVHEFDERPSGVLSHVHRGGSGVVLHPGEADQHRADADDPGHDADQVSLRLQVGPLLYVGLHVSDVSALLHLDSRLT